MLTTDINTDLTVGFTGVFFRKKNFIEAILKSYMKKYYKVLQQKGLI